MVQAGASRVQARCTFEESATVGVTGLHCRSPDGEEQITLCNLNVTVDGWMPRNLVAGFARLLFHCPAFAIMDEATSAMDVLLEASCMQRCIDRGIGIISVGHRPTLLPYHTHVLSLEGHGKYTLRLQPVAAASTGSASAPAVDDLEQHGESVASSAHCRSPFSGSRRSCAQHYPGDSLSTAPPSSKIITASKRCGCNLAS